MRALLLLLGLSLSFLFGSACSDKEGILLNVSTMSDTVYSLSFYVGKDDVVGAGYYSETKVILDEVVEGRDLASNPFTLFLTPPESGEELLSGDVFVGILARNMDGNIVGYGSSDTLRFVSGKILEWDVEIQALERESESGQGFQEFGDCRKWRVGPPDEGLWIQIGGEFDEDCDGARTDSEPPDCNDHNPDIRPGIDERCNNQIDDNCNDMVDVDEDVDQDSYSPCAAEEEQRDCDDTNENLYPALVSVCEGEVWSCEGEQTTPTITEGGVCYELDTANEQCKEGKLMCSDTNTGVPLDCVLMEESNVRIGFCVEEPDCELSETGACVPTEHVSCMVNFTSLGGETNPAQICNDGIVPVMVTSYPIPDGPPGCKKAIVVDEGVIDRWKIKVRDGKGDCVGDVIEAKRDLSNKTGLPNSPVVIEQRNELGQVLYRYIVEVGTMSVESCEGFNGIDCTSNGQAWDAVVVEPNN